MSSFKKILYYASFCIIVIVFFLFNIRQGTPIYQIIIISILGGIIGIITGFTIKFIIRVYKNMSHENK